MGMKADRGEHIMMTGGIERSETAVSVTAHDDECLNPAHVPRRERVCSSGGALVVDVAVRSISEVVSARSSQLAMRGRAVCGLFDGAPPVCRPTRRRWDALIGH